MVTNFNEPAELIAKFMEIKDSGRVICIFSGAPNAHGVNWCPDCDVAKPAISKVLESPKCPPVLYGSVIERNSWVGVSTHPYKQHPILKAAGVPTVVMFEDGQERHRVDDLKDFANEELMAMFLEE